MRLVVLPRALAMILLRKRELWNASEALAIDGVPGMVCIWQVILLTDSCYMEATTSALFQQWMLYALNSTRVSMWRPQQEPAVQMRTDPRPNSQGYPSD